jgi:hypothetical protein
MQEGFGYSEPLRRFIQREPFEPQANELPNEMPSWLPGAGYAALHPELEDVDPEDYPDINKLAILADVAPYSRQFHTFRQKVAAEAKDDTELELEYERILDRVRQTRESTIQMEERHFSAPTETINGTIAEASPRGVTLKEYPGRFFSFSSVGMSAADMSARILGEHNDMTRFPRPASHKSPRAPAPEAGAIAGHPCARGHPGTACLPS